MIPVQYPALRFFAVAFALLGLLSACSHDADRANPIDPTLTPPVELTVTTSDTVGAAFLTWTRYEGLADFSAYLVIRNETRSTEFDTLARIGDVAQTTWTDSTSGTGTSFTYSVDVLHAGGHVSPGSPQAVQALQLLPVLITNLTIDSPSATAQLRWTRYQGARFAAYEVHRITGNDDVLVHEVAAINDTTFIETGLLGGSMHAYRVAVRTTLGERVQSLERSEAFHQVAREWDMGFTIGNVDNDFVRLSTEDGVLRALVDRFTGGVRLVDYSVDGTVLAEAILLDRKTSLRFPNYQARARTTASASPMDERWLSVFGKGGTAQGVVRIDAGGAIVRDRFEMQLPAVAVGPTPADTGAVEPGFDAFVDGIVVYAQDGTELQRTAYTGMFWEGQLPPTLQGAWGAYSIRTDLIGIFRELPFTMQMGDHRLILRLSADDPANNPGGSGTAHLIWAPGDGSKADSTDVPYPAYGPLSMPVRMGLFESVPTATLEPPAFAHRHTDASGANWSSLATIDGRVANTAGAHAFVIHSAGDSAPLDPFDSAVSELRVWQLAGEPVPRMAACLPEANRVEFGQVARRIPWRESLRRVIEPRFDPEEISLYYPLSMAAGPDGRMYVLDAGNARIVVFDRDGEFITHFGTPGSGPGQFNFGTDARIQGGLNFAGSIAVDDDGFIYVADTGNGRIQVFEP